jgi:hypothetical protein
MQLLLFFINRLVPIQYLIGIFMLLLSDYVHRMIELDDVKIGNGLYFVFLIFQKAFYSIDL